MNYPRHTGAYRALSFYVEDMRPLGALVNRRLRRRSAREVAKDWEQHATSSEPVTIQTEPGGFPGPEHYRGCDLPRCPVCHWTDMGWGSEAEAIASWRNHEHP